MSKGWPEHFAFLTLFAGVSILLFFVFAPFIQILVLAGVLAALLQRPYENLTRLLWGTKSLAAALVVLLVLLFCIVPLFFLSVQIFSEAQSIYVQSSAGGAQYLHTVQNAIIHFVQRFSPTFTFDAGLYVGDALSFISGNLATFVSVTLSLILKTFLMLLAFFFFLRDGRALLATLVSVSPFGREETNEILTKMYYTTKTVLKGTLVVALIRWVLIGLTFYLFGIPNAILWGSIGGIVGAIPGLGTLFVFVPAVAYVYFQGGVLSALGIALFGLAIFVLIDNMLTPYYFGKGLQVSQIFVLFSILGGVIFFGPVGLVMGPLVLSVFLSILTIYSTTPKLPKS
jgi:predicted PurR-regulated permease PerM